MERPAEHNDRNSHRPGGSTTQPRSSPAQVTRRRAALNPHLCRKVAIHPFCAPCLRGPWALHVTHGGVLRAVSVSLASPLTAEPGSASVLLVNYRPQFAIDIDEPRWDENTRSGAGFDGSQSPTFADGGVRGSLGVRAERGFPRLHGPQQVGRRLTMAVPRTTRSRSWGLRAEHMTWNSINCGIERNRCR